MEGVVIEAGASGYSSSTTSFISTRRVARAGKRENGLVEETPQAREKNSAFGGLEEQGNEVWRSQVASAKR
jgi:hypothetical protein